jgi:hypothetical protein
MDSYEYRILHGPPGGTWLMPWASQSAREEVGRGSFERKLNKLADEGWEVVSFSTASEGNFAWSQVAATVLLRRAKPAK